MIYKPPSSYEVLLCCLRLEVAHRKVSLILSRQSTNSIPVFNRLGPAADFRFVLGKISMAEMGCDGVWQGCIGTHARIRTIGFDMHGMLLP